MRRRIVAERLVDLLILLRLETRIPSRATADRAHVVVEREHVVEIVRQGRVMPARTDPGLVDPEPQQPVTLEVVPLALAGDDRPAGQVALGVEVLVTLGGLPA